MYIFHIAAELTPIAKVGGLADVVLGLCRELSWKGHQVEIILPKYDCLDLSKIDYLQVFMHDLWSFFRGQWHHNSVWRGIVQGIPVFFIEPHDSHHSFNRGKIYGCIDDVDRFLYFSRASLEFLLRTQKNPQILHIHDWPTAVIAPLYYDMYRPIGLKDSRVVLTIHNIEYQGRCNPKNLDDIGLAGSYYHYLDRMQDEVLTHDLNLLKGGIVYSDFVTTVSPNYAKEIFTPQYGMGLEKTLEKHKQKFCGILNGVDYSYWNPEIDPHLPYHFSSNISFSNERPFIPEKEKIKEFLRNKLSLDSEDKPLVSCITRLVSQKGPHLIKQGLELTLELGGQFILLGSSADEKTQEEFLTIKTNFAQSSDLHIELTFQEGLSHLVYAASDLILVPSIFEPCGLTQMIAMKYGTVPLVRATGGLADTVFDIDDPKVPESARNGYSFLSPTEEAFSSCLTRAIHCWFEEPEKWAQIMKQGLQKDFSWDKSCNHYLKIYQNLAHAHALEKT